MWNPVFQTIPESKGGSQLVIPSQSFWMHSCYWIQTNVAITNRNAWIAVSSHRIYLIFIAFSIEFANILTKTAAISVPNKSESLQNHFLKNSRENFQVQTLWDKSPLNQPVIKFMRIVTWSENCHLISGESNPKKYFRPPLPFLLLSVVNAQFEWTSDTPIKAVDYAAPSRDNENSPIPALSGAENCSRRNETRKESTRPEVEY